LKWIKKKFSVSIKEFCAIILLVCFFIGYAVFGQDRQNKTNQYGLWMKQPQSEWPQISMINQIEYTDRSFPVAGCGFLLDTGEEIIAATAKHILIFFKSDSMNAVAFNQTLKAWKMLPKNNPDDFVILDSLINENPKESL